MEGSSGLLLLCRLLRLKGLVLLQCGQQLRFGERPLIWLFKAVKDLRLLFLREGIRNFRLWFRLFCRQGQLLRHPLHGRAIRREVGHAVAVVSKQHLSVFVQHQSKRQLIQLVFGRGIPLLASLLDDAHALQRIAAQHAALLGNLEVIVQRALRIADQLKGQRAPGRGLGNGLGPGAYHAGQTDTAQRVDGLQILGDKMPGDGVPEVGQEHQHHRLVPLQKAVEAFLRFVRGIVGKRRNFITGL